MRALVLVGGEGTRLRPLTLTTPKQMLPVAGVPMIERVVGHLARHGIDRVVLSMGYRPDAFLDAYPDGRCGGVEVEYAVESEPLDTAGAIRFAARRAGFDDVFVVLNGDVITEIDISAVVKFHASHGASATLALTPVDDPSRFGVVPTDEDGRVVAFIEKPGPGEAPTNLINAGVYVLEPSVIDRIPDGRRVSIERETFPQLVADRSLFALASDATWIDVGTPAAYIEANLTFAGVGPDAAVVGHGVRVDPGACITGSVVLDEAVIAADAVVRDSIIGRRAVIGEGAIVEALSVIGDGAIVPPGAHLTGARLPEEAA
ncbi:MAG TPA: NDP-sugar synthase [Acidimicrobiales bacterium]|nr:NDP-sugar synthase [Acidimicrobiales bacterium]